MSDINLNLYKIFCTVAESKNYKEASEKLFITESTVSSHIKNLEKKLDIVLFYRERDEKSYENIRNNSFSYNSNVYFTIYKVKNRSKQTNGRGELLE